MKRTNAQLQPPRSHQLKPSGLRKLATIGCLMACFALYGLRHLAPPVEYALCSEANGIYSVDVVKPRAECLLVRGSRIASLGYIGVFYARLL
jgi:hypothetical protein